MQCRCGLEIQKPICILCLSEKYEAWIEENKLSLLNQYKKVVQKISESARLGRITCSLCRSQSERIICEHCFAAQIFNWLQSKEPELAQRFAMRFLLPPENYLIIKSKT